jgi:hypothetical protein
MFVFACALTVLVAGFYVLVPLLRESGEDLEAELSAETDLDRLLERKAVILGNLKDLDFEYRMDRLSEEDFAALEAGYKNEVAAILQQLDQLTAENETVGTADKESSARRMPAVARCPSCGAEAVSGKKFCADCGHRL